MVDHNKEREKGGRVGAKNHWAWPQITEERIEDELALMLFFRLMFMGDGCREGSVIFHYYPRDPSMGRKKRENTVRGGVKWQK